MVSKTRNAAAPENRPVRYGRWISGLGLILIGVLVLIEQYVESRWLGFLFLLALGGMFLLWGGMLRSVGLLIPGGMLTGLSLGVALEGWLLNLGGKAEGGVFLLTLALG